MNFADGSKKGWAYLLIAGGALLLAANMGWLGAMTGWLWGLLFLAGGGAFLYYFMQNRQHWWALIPGFALAATGLTTLLGAGGGPLFLALLGAGFLAVFLTNKERWWAVIPGGVLLTLALVDWVEVGAPGYDSGWLLFLGIAATFGFLYLRPDGGVKQRWAVWPAVAGLAMGLLGLLDTSMGGLLAPLALIGLGVYLFTRDSKPKVTRDATATDSQAPQTDNHAHQEVDQSE